MGVVSTCVVWCVSRAAEIERLRQGWEKKLYMTQKSIEKVGNVEAIRSISDRQARVCDVM